MALLGLETLTAVFPTSGSYNLIFFPTKYLFMSQCTYVHTHESICVNICALWLQVST